jgi:hypothetical protein
MNERQSSSGKPVPTSPFVVRCEACGEDVVAGMIHLGASNAEALYCSSCPRVLLLRTPDLLERFGIKRPALGPNFPGFQPFLRHLLPFYAKVEALFLPCECGGHYGYMNPPRCPKCNGLLRGDVYGDKPIAKVTDGYALVTLGAVDDMDQLKPRKLG